MQDVDADRTGDRLPVDLPLIDHPERDHHDRRRDEQHVQDPDDPDQRGAADEELDDRDCRADHDERARMADLSRPRPDGPERGDQGRALEQDEHALRPARRWAPRP